MKCYHCNSFNSLNVTISKKSYCQTCLDEINNWRANLGKNPYLIDNRPTIEGETDTEDSDSE